MTPKKGTRKPVNRKLNNGASRRSTTGTPRWMPRTFLLICLLFPAGCQTPRSRLNNLDRLKNHPEFPAAAKAAPNFVKEVGKTIADLELELERK